MAAVKSSESGEIVFGRFRLNTERRELFYDERRIRLGGRPIDILCILASAGGNLVTKDELLERLWPGRAVEEGNLYVHVSALRRALGENGDGHSYIVTVPGRGYRLAGLGGFELLGMDEVKRGVIVLSDRSDIVSAESTTDPGADTPRTDDVRILDRRQLTVVSCELVGVARLATLLDPEDLSAAISRFYRCWHELVAPLGGGVVQTAGGILLGYFGYPRAGEHDAEQAVRAGFALVEAVRHLDVAGEAPRVRIGIATGPVVIGDLIEQGGGDRQLIGETVTLAAALRRTAEPGVVVIAESTRRLIGDLFDVQTRESLTLRGFDEPVESYNVLRSGEVDSRFQALRGSRLTPIVGRDEELDILMRRWRRAKSGEPRVVLIAGEPGIGKSRLCAELRDRIRREPHTSIEYFCSPYHQDVVFYPVIRQLEVAAGFESGDSREVKLSRLRALLVQDTSASEDDVAVLADMLSLGVESIAKLSARRRRELAFETLLRRLDTLSKRRPVLISLEDAHWIDPSTLEFLDLVVRNTTRRPVLLLITFRPEFEAPWTGQSHVAALMLTRLDRHDSETLARRVIGEQGLRSDLIDAIVARADGVPLFIEELTKAVLEDAAPHGRSTVPATLHASLMARLDRVPRAKQVAQIGAVIGRTFSYGLLAEAGGVPPGQLAEGLDELLASGLVATRGSPPEATYTFKHALVQDVAYQSLLRSRRRKIHAAIVAACEKSDHFDIEPGVLAHHSAQAGLIGKANVYYRLAADQSIERAAIPETRRQLERGLAFAASLPEGGERDELEAELLLALATTLQTTASMSNVEAGRHFSRALSVASRNPTRPRLLSEALWGQFTNVLVRGEVAQAGELARRLVDMPLTCDGVHTQLAATAAMGIALCYQGHFDVAREHLLRHQTILETQAEAAELDWRTMTAGAAFLALTSACLGYPGQAATQLDRAVALASQKGSFAIAYSLSVAVRVLIVLRDDCGLRKHATKLVALSEEKGFNQFLSQGLCALGWVDAKAGAVPEGLDRLRHGLAGMLDLTVLVSLPFYRSLLADALPSDKGAAEGLAVLGDALELSVRTEDNWFAAELHRMSGELLADPTAAEAELRRALWLAREQSAKLFELRAAISLAKLWEKRGKRSEAHNLVAPVYHWFTEGTDTPDLREARRVMDRLC